MNKPSGTNGVISTAAPGLARDPTPQAKPGTTLMSITVTTKDQLIGPPQEGVHCVFADLTGEPLVKFCRTQILSARPELKGLPYLQFVTKSKGEEGVVVAEATNTDAPLVLIAHELSFKEAHPLADVVGTEFRVWLHQGFGASVSVKH